jgi:branched-chain amino acid transport system substrate-binding protein
LPADQIRVATASKGDAYGQGLFDALSPILEFNGQSASDNGNNFLPVSYPDPSTMTVDFAPTVNQIVEFVPHIVLALGTTEGIVDIMGGIETAWPTAGDPPPRPYYLFPDGGRLDELLAATDGNEALRMRVKGTVPGRKGDNYSAFSLRFRGAFNNVVPGTFAENAYDAGYLLSYALVSLGESPVSGAAIAEGLRKMSQGTEVVVGPNTINAAISALAGGATINFDGASGPLDFDNERGEAPSDVEIWCIDIDSVTMDPIFVPDDQYYDAEAQAVVGSATCP